LSEQRIDKADGTTRLISRWRLDYKPGLGMSLALRGFLEPIAQIMQRQMLLGIKKRVEGATALPA